jgi:excinuclease ABC subunit A
VHGIIGETIGLGKQDAKKWSANGCTITSDVEISRMLLVDQKPIGISSRSTPSSYLGIWDEIRKLFANTVEAKARGWTTSYFSYNTGKGKCPECKGQGQIKLEMSFLPDASLECELCGGSRFSDDANTVRYLDLNVSEVLKLTFEEAREVFANHRKIHLPIHQACELGLGYLTLGQSSNSLSGGESQRIKLVSELSSPQRGHTLYVLDEPTKGLHKSDVSRLMRTLRSLVALGNTILVIEHDPDVIKQSDFIFELGPGPGEQGGRCIYSGSPAGLLNAETPWGRVLRTEQEESRKYPPPSESELAHV